MKNCPKCGKELPDDAVFCPGCGSPMPMNGGTQPVNGGTQPMNGGMPPVNGGMAPVNGGQGMQNAGAAPAPKKGSVSPKMIGIGVVAVLAILVVILACSLLGGGGYKKAVTNVINALNKQSTNPADFALYDDPYSVAFDSVARSVFKGTELLEDWEDDTKDYYEDLYDDLEDQYGKNWKFTVEFEEAEKLDKDDIEDYEDSLRDLADEFDDYDWDEADAYDDFVDYMDENYDIDLKDADIKKIINGLRDVVKLLENGKIQAAYEVKFSISIKGKDDDETWKFRKAIFIKIDGNWYWVDCGDKDYFYKGSHSSFGTLILGYIFTYLED